MRNTRIYQQIDLVKDSELSLDKVASQHICRVLRLAAEDEIILFNGKGQSALATIIDCSGQSCQVQLHKLIQEQTESELAIHLGLGISKGDRMDYAIQKSVEAGVKQITPLITERTIVKLDSKREQKRIAHWQGIIIAACEQSGRSYLPTINPVMHVHEWLNLSAQCKLVFDCDAEQSLITLPSTNDVAILIGPEGGLSQVEVENATAKDFIKARLGPRILRTETAAAIACGVLQMLWGDYR